MSGIFGKLRSGASKTAFEAGKIARVRKVEGEIAQIRKQIDAFQERLGEVTYLSHIHEEPQGQDALDYIEQITKLGEELIAKQQEMKDIQEEKFGSEDAGGNVQCPNCNTMNSANTKFCSNCGTRLS